MKKQQFFDKKDKKSPPHRQSHFGIYGSRQPVTGSDHKKYIHDKVDNFVREDGFKRRTVKGVEHQQVNSKITYVRKKNYNKVLSKKQKFTLTLLFLFSLLVLIVFLISE